MILPPKSLSSNYMNNCYSVPARITETNIAATTPAYFLPPLLLMQVLPLGSGQALMLHASH